MDRLEEYAERIELKRRTMGGLDEEDVRYHMGELCRLAREENRKLEKQLKEAREELEETRKKLKHYRTAYRDRQKENGQQEPGSEEIRKIYDEKYHEKYQEMVVAVEVLHKARKEAEGTVRKEMQEEMDREAEKVRGRLREEMMRNRQEAERELSRLREEVEGLEYRKQYLEGAIRRDQEQWKQHIGWMIRRLGLREEDFPQQTGGFTGDESGEALPARAGDFSEAGSGQDTEDRFPELAYTMDTDWITDRR